MNHQILPQIPDYLLIMLLKASNENIPQDIFSVIANILNELSFGYVNENISLSESLRNREFFQNHWSFIGIDKANDQLYILNGYSSNSLVYRISVFNNFEEYLKVGKDCHSYDNQTVEPNQIMLNDFVHYGTYHVVENGILYMRGTRRKLTSSPEKHNTILKIDLSTKELIGEMKIENAVTTNTGLGWGGYTDINLMYYGGNIYILYHSCVESKVVENWVLLKINQRTMKKMKQWIIPNISTYTRRSIGFAFLVHDKLYIGSNYSSAIVDSIFRLSSCTVTECRIELLTGHGSYYVSYIGWFQKTNQLIIVSHLKSFIFDNATC